MFKEETFVCLCRNRDHTIAFNRIEKELCVEIRLNPYMSFWKRFVAAIKFLFKNSYNVDTHWDTVILNSDDSNRLVGILQDHITLNTKENDE